jgi:type VI secretion system secreted protein VgrG
MATFGQTNRLLSFSCVALGPDDLLPENLTGEEGISELFAFEVDLLATPKTEIDPKAIVGQKATVTIQATDDKKVRYINGYINSLELYGGDDEFIRYKAHIVPNIWTLTLNKNTRVFQDKTVIEVIKAVLSPYNITPDDKTSNPYSPMDYCTQYRETDFNFVSRLMEQFGVFYYFVHTANDHKMTLQDQWIHLDDCPIKNTFRYTPQGHSTEGYYDFVVSDFTSKNTMVTGVYTSWDYNFPGYTNYQDKKQVPTPIGDNQNENYDYIGSAAAYTNKKATLKDAQDLNHALNVIRGVSTTADSALIATGTSNAICLQSGYTATLSNHPQASLNVKYLVTHIQHQVSQFPSYRTRSAAVAAPYSNSFWALPFSIVYHPPIRAKKPVVHGMHTGKVVVPSGEDSYMDKYGRVCVQFWWDRLRKPNTTDNTLLRVAQSWAGKGWGTYFWPRVDDEVLIDFLEGDPDQPIVVGSVYNGANMPKYDPAGQYTLSGVLTRSSKNGGAANANELRFEDLKGSEQIYMNAERDYDLHVEHDWHTQVDNERHAKITKDQYEEVDGDSHLTLSQKLYESVGGDAHLSVTGKQIVQIGGDRSHTVSGNLKESIGANSNISVSANLNEQIGSNYSLTVGQNQAIQAGMNFDVSAPMQISFTCGPNSIVMSPEGIGLNGEGGFISIGPAGVTISGMMVMINSGGAPVTGSPGNAQSPQSPDSPTAPKAPTFPGDNPYSKPKSGS